VATAEYTAVIVLLSIVLAAGGATFTDDGRQIAAKIPVQIKRGLCIVAGGGCDENGESRPCVVSSVDRRRDASADIAFIRLSDGRRVVRERLSDGSFRVTVVQSGGVGGIAGIGGKLNLKGLDIDANADGSAGVGGGYGRVFEVGGAAAADRLIARLNDEDWKVGGAARGLVRFAGGHDGGDETERFFELRAGADADAALGALDLDAATASAVLETAGGLRVDRRSGERTLSLRKSVTSDLGLDAQIGRLTGGLGREHAVELVLDRGNRPKALVVRAAGAVSAGAQSGPYAVARADRGEFEAHLDLADPAARALGDRLLHGDVGVMPELTRRLWDQARLEARHYRTASEDSTEGLSGGFGARAGYEIARSSERARLVSATGRDPGMGWTRRLDCELAAGVPLA
jgi:hypothetical protein